MARESLLQSSSILLFGRELDDLKIANTGFTPPDRLPRKGKNLFLQQQFLDMEAKLARIYAFSFEASFYELARPSIFLVHGEGRDPEFPPASDPRSTRAPAIAEQTGLSNQIGSFAKDIRVWAYDKDDISLRLDVQTGPLDEILLGDGSRPDLAGMFNGAMGRSSGGRSSGAMGRSSGVVFRKIGDE